MVHCPSCSAGLRFDIESQKMVCDYCQNSFDPQQIIDKTSDDAKTEKTFDAYVYSCPSCGGELMTTDKNDAVGFCPYCGGASMIFDKIRQEWKPDSVIPFSVTKEQCKEAYAKEVKRHLFVSGKYRNPELLDSFRGIYMPFWDYKAKVEGKCVVRMDGPEKSDGDNYYVTHHYDFEMEADFTVSGFSHDASIAFDDHLSEKLVPYDHSKSVPFSPAYLCGFYAETGDTDEKEYDYYANSVFDDFVKEEMTKTKAYKKKIQNAEYTPDWEKSKIPYMKKEVERGLYPVWFMSYRRGKKITYATVNGQTGKVGADLPLSPLRIIIAALGLGAAIFGLIMLLMQALPSIKATTMLGVCSILAITGMYAMRSSLLQTICNAVKTSTYSIECPPKKNTLRLSTERLEGSSFSKFFYAASALAVVLMITYTSDGSYEHFLGTVAGIALIPVSIAFLVLIHLQSKEYKKVKYMKLFSESQMRNGIIKESKRFLKINNFFKYFFVITTILHFLFVMSDVSSKIAYYILCIFTAAELLVMAIVQIRFQTGLAKRELPQLNKKGAYYDEK